MRLLASIAASASAATPEQARDHPPVGAIDAAVEAGVVRSNDRE